MISDDVNVVNPIECCEWDNLPASRAESTFFHTAGWARVISETYGYRPVYFTVRSGKRLAGLIAMMEIRSAFTGVRGVSLPFSDYCPTIADDSAQLQNMLGFVREYGRKCGWKSMEIRGGDYPETDAATFFYGHTLKLAINSEQIFSGFKETVRRNIRKSIREGVEINVCRSLDAVREYFRLHCITRKKHGLPPQPWLFFRKIYEHIISKDAGLVVLASYRGENIAGSVFFNFRDKALYKFGASDYRYQHLRANNLVMWEAIKLYAQKGYQSFCFGRTEPENEGLRQFKNGWGTQEHIVNYYRYDLRQNAFVKDMPALKKSYHNVFEIMPVPLLKLCGRLLYKHIG